MIKRFYIKKLIMSSLVLIIILTLYFIPNQKDKLEIEEKISHVNYNLETNEIYLLDNNNYLSRKKLLQKRQMKNWFMKF